MNTKERLAWDKHLADQLPLTTEDESQWVAVPGKLPSKANLHEIRFNPGLWAQLKLIVELWRKKNPGKSPYWIGPSDTVKSYEELCAYHARSMIVGRFVGKLQLDIILHGQRVDVDAIKAIPDSLQRSGIVANDNQFIVLHVEKRPILSVETPSVAFRIRKGK